MRGRGRSIIKGALFFLYFCLGHTLIFGVFLFSTPFMIGSTDLSYDVEEMMSPSEEKTYAQLLEDRSFSLQSRIALMDEAQETLYVSTFTASDGLTKEIVFGAMLEAADRGVEVRFVMDGLARFETISDYGYLDALATHENIEIRYYEPFNPLLPHTIQNRLHDKMFIIDEHYATSGGRNIADRYFLGEASQVRATYDRDILIFGEEEHSTVQEMKAYYEELFYDSFSKEYRIRREDSRDVFEEAMRNAYRQYHEEHDLASVLIEIKNTAIEVDRASFIRGPLERGKKYPVVLETIAELASHYDEWFIQSPYIIFSDPMMKFLPDHEDKTITFLTNNLAESPNAWARGAYLLFREELAEVGTLYEFQSKDSIHAKSMIFGDDISVVGALNVDPRSAFLSTENMVVIYSEEFRDELYGAMNEFALRSLEVSPDGEYIDNPDVDALEMRWQRHISLRLRSVVARFFAYMF